MVSVGVIGANGRMGRIACSAVDTADDLQLAATVVRGQPLDALEGCDVVVELTHPDVAMDHVRWCVEHGRHVVVGTSGFGADRLHEIEELLAGRSDPVGVVVVPNFCIGAVLAMRMAALAAPYFESVEIVETHHPDKRDAPSGTAVHTAELVAQARSDAGVGPAPDATVDDPYAARGGDVDGVRVHSLRVRGAVAHQETVFGGPGELLTIRHNMLDRSATAAGILASVRAVRKRPGLTVGLEPILGVG